MTKIFLTAALAAIVAALTLPVGANAMTPAAAAPRHYDLQTRMAADYGAGEYDGTLSLTVYPSGIVQGYYRPLDGGFRPVSGGLNGDKIWLDIGQSGRLRLLGTFKNGALESVVQAPGPDIVRFTAVPIQK